MTDERLAELSSLNVRGYMLRGNAQNELLQELKAERKRLEAVGGAFPKGVFKELIPTLETMGVDTEALQAALGEGDDE